MGPIAYGEKQNNTYIFENIGRNIVYLSVYYINNHIEPFASPFIVELNGNIKYLEADENKYNYVELNRKYFLSQRMHKYVKRIVGGKIESANKADFSDAKLIHTITKWSIFSDSVLLKNSPARYWRYISPKGGLCNIVELELYSQDNLKLKIENIIGTDGIYDINDTSTGRKDAVFDGNPLTFFDAPSSIESPWVGVDLGKPTYISNIIYTPRNDDNNIRIDDDYELFYWGNNRWNSLGIKKAHITSKINFENVPVGVLLLLRDLTRGKEERIFTYENKTQNWW